MNALVALDGSEISEKAAQAVARLGDIAGEVRLLMVRDPASVHGTGEQVPAATLDPTGTVVIVPPRGRAGHLIETHEQSLTTAAEEGKAYLRQLAARLFPNRDVEVQVEFSEGTADAIVHAAEAASADLIAMGTHGRGGLRRVVMGSVAERVVRISPIPVIVVGPAGHVKGPTTHPREGQTRHPS